MWRRKKAFLCRNCSISTSKPYIIFMHRGYIKKNETAIKHHHQICIVPAMDCRHFINAVFLFIHQHIFVMFSLLFLCYFCCHFILLLWYSLQQLHRWTIFPTRRIILLAIYWIKAALSSYSWTHHNNKCNVTPFQTLFLCFKPNFELLKIGANFSNFSFLTFRYIWSVF